MRRIIWGLTLLALLWSGWWFVASTGLSRGLDSWFAARRAEGWQAEVADIGVAGFPLTLETTLDAPQLADPDTGLAFSALSLQISAPAWWPGYVTLRLPSEPLQFATPEGRAQLALESGVAQLRLHPGAALELETMALTAGPWSADTPDGTLLSAQDLTLAMRQDAADPVRYGFDVKATGFAPGDLPRRALRVPDDWPLAFDRFILSAQIAFDRPWDRSAIEVSRPQPRQITLDLAEAVWGDLRLKAAGDLSVDADGIPTGKLALQAQNWRQMLDLAQNAGLLPGALRPQVEKSLGALAGFTGNPDALDIQINFAGGLMAVGFVPLGPAPRLILR